MYVVASNNKQISLVSSCFDCFACTTYAEDELQKPLESTPTS